MSQGEEQPDPRGQEPGSNPQSRLLLKTWSDGEAMMVRQLLATYGIPCQVVSDVPHAVFPLSVDGLGEIRVLVPRSRYEEARSLLADHLRQGLEVLDGGRSSGDGGEGLDVA